MLRTHVRKGGSAVSLLLTMLLVAGIVLCGVAVSPVTSVQATPSATPNVSLASGYYHSLLVSTDGTLWAWGRNDKYQLGLGNTTQTKSSPTQVGSATNWKSVAAGWYHSMGVRSDGTLWAWGLNERGQLGLGDNVTRNSPTRVGTATNWTAVSTGQDHSLGLSSDRTLWAWGYNLDGQLGLGDNVTRNIPTRVGNWTDWVAIAAGDTHSLGVRANGTLWVWGSNSNYELGLNHQAYMKNPTQVVGSADWEAVASEFKCSFGLRSNGTLWAWGYNGQGQLGVGHKTDTKVPTQVLGDFIDWAGVAPGRVHCLGVRSNGHLYAWGANFDGELGMGEDDTDERLFPNRVGSAANWVTASDGDAWSVGVRSDGTLWGWGRNWDGQLGLGTIDKDQHRKPEKCPTLTMDWPPSVDTLAATGIWANAATLNGNVANLGSASPVQVSFEYGLTTSYGYSTTPQALYSTGAFNTAIGNLEPQTTYHYRAKADGDGDGDDYGEDLTFTTNTVVAIPPTVATGTASGIGSTSATLSGTLTSMGTALSVQVCFEYGLTTSYGYTITPQTLDGTGTFHSTLNGLAPGTTYHYRAEAVGDGAAYGGDSTFTTGTDPPVVTTGAATSLGTTSATLGGALTSMGTASSVQVCFEYGLTASYGHATTPQTLSNIGAFSVTLNDLTRGTTYHYRAKATGHGSSHGVDASFTTSAMPPVVATNDPSKVAASTARLNGYLTLRGNAETVTVSFQWGTGPSAYSGETPSQAMGTSGGFYFDLSGLAPGTTYYYRAIAVGDGDPAFGTEKSFTTVQGPKVDFVDPGSGKPGQHLTVTIYGSSLDGATNISFGSDIVVEDFTVNSTNEITAEIAIGAGAAKGARDVSVTTGGGTATKADGFQVVGGGGGVCGGAGLATPGAPSEMTTTLTALGLLFAVGYWLVRQRAKSGAKSVRS